MKKIHVVGLAISMGIGMCGALAEEVPTTRSEGPERILRMLDQKERDYVEGKTTGENLSDEDRAHAERIVRLHALESSKAIVTEPAGASVPAAPTSRPVVDEKSAVEELEIIQQENATVMLREMARLRAEVLRLNARVQALEMEFDGTADPLLEEPEPQFYLPIR